MPPYSCDNAIITIALCNDCGVNTALRFPGQGIVSVVLSNNFVSSVACNMYHKFLVGCEKVLSL